MKIASHKESIEIFAHRHTHTLDDFVVSWSGFACSNDSLGEAPFTCTSMVLDILTSSLSIDCQQEKPTSNYLFYRELQTWCNIRHLASEIISKFSNFPQLQTLKT